MFPSFRAWVMALKLAIPAYGGAAVVFGFEFWRFLILGILVASSEWEIAALCLVISVAALIAGLLWFLLIAGLYSLLLKLLWSNPPKWCSSPAFPKLALRDFPILVLSSLPLSSIDTAFNALTALRDIHIDVTYVDAYVEEYTAFLLRFSVAWFAATAYAYHLWPRSGAK